MPATRSSSRIATAQAASNESKLSGALKRKSGPNSSGEINLEKKTKKPRVTASKAAAGSEVPTPQLPSTARVIAGSPPEGAGNEDTPVPAVLTFDFETAKKHLISVDARFEDIFARMPCRPFEQLEQVHPFRALTISILGQQISWKAARSITHKFIRLYNPDLLEQVTDESREEAMEVFPSPHQVITTDVATLRTAGLSARKAEYVQDLASRFADGRLSTEKLRNATDEELGEMLIQVKGIGRWTIDMFAIFSLRRPNILPVGKCHLLFLEISAAGSFMSDVYLHFISGDLGVQRGVVRWFLSQHSAAHPYGLSPEKVGGVSAKPKQKTKTKTVAPNIAEEVEDALPGPGDANFEPQEPDAGMADGLADGAGSVGGETSLLPPMFTPSIHKTLKKASRTEVPLPAGLTVSVLKGRLDGKKVKGSFLTPQEMTDLTESWKPYRSLGVYYMWSLAAPAEE